VREFRFGGQVITTKVNLMVPVDVASQHVDITAAMDDRPAARRVPLNVIAEDPFGEVAVTGEITS
jgi:hypothetical protein